MTENVYKAKTVSDNEVIELLRKHIETNIAMMDLSPKDSEISEFEKRLDAYGTMIDIVSEIQQYRAIGTVEECREARERQRGKKPILCMNEVSGMFVDYADGHGEYKTQMNNFWRCPCCNEVVGQRVIAHGHIHDQRKKKFCENRGQAIDWSE